MGKVVVFTKSECPHCLATKDFLSGLGIGYQEVDIEENSYNSALMAHVSNRASVPQIFFNNEHIGGNSELNALGADKVRELATSAVNESTDPEFMLNPLDDEQIQLAKMPVRSILEPAIPDNSKELPEYVPVKMFYGNFFNTLPVSYDYMAIKPDALALWVPNLIEAMRLTAGTSFPPEFFGSLALAFAMPSGCDYCSSHSTERIELQGSEQHVRAMSGLVSHIQGKSELDDLLYSEEEKALVNIAIKATVRTLRDEDFDRLRCVVGIDRIYEACFALGGMGTLMGFMNRWHDLIGLDSQDHHIENAETSNPDLGDLKMPMGDGNGPPDMGTILQQAADNSIAYAQPWMSKYADLPDVRLPAWMGILPSSQMRQTTGALYHCIFGDGDLTSEIKHLCAYGMAMDTGFENIAAEEQRILHEICKDKEQLSARIDFIDKHYKNGNFDALNNDDEVLSLALQLARCAQMMPVYVPGSLTRHLQEKLTAGQVTELILCFSIMGLAQRWLSIYVPLNRYCTGPGG